MAVWLQYTLSIFPSISIHFHGNAYFLDKLDRLNIEIYFREKSTLLDFRVDKEYCYSHMYKRNREDQRKLQKINQWNDNDDLTERSAKNQKLKPFSWCLVMALMNKDRKRKRRVTQSFCTDE